MKRLGICLLNISEGRNTALVEGIAVAAVSSSHETRLSDRELGLQCTSTVLNIFSDYDYNRSVLTVAGPLHYLAHSVYSACREAFRVIDLEKQNGIHPRLGAVDLIPIYPLSWDVGLEECGQLAKEIASNLARDVPGSSFFLFGAADVPHSRDLVQRRRQIGWFQGKHGTDYACLKYDLGSQPSARYGLTGAGACLYTTNYNVTITTKDVSIGREIADGIRATMQGGLPGVRAMAFAHEGNVEIACNVEHIPDDAVNGVPNDALVNSTNCKTSVNKCNKTSPVECVPSQCQRDINKGIIKIAPDVENIHDDASTQGSTSPNFEALKDSRNYDEAHPDRIFSNEAKVVETQRDIYHNVSYMSPAVIGARVEALAAKRGIGLVDTSIIGFTPQEAHQLAMQALNMGQVDFWRTRIPGEMM